MKLGWRGALGTILSVALLWWVFHQVPWGAARDHILHANLGLLILSAIAATGIFPLRARRWRTILDPVEQGIPFRPLWRATAIGMMVTNVVPARAGELARAYVLTRQRPSVPFSTAFASVAVDRSFDAIVLLGLAFVAIALPSFPSHGLTGSVATKGGLALAVTILLLAGLYTFVFFPQRIIGLFELVARRIAPRLEERGRKILQAFADGLGVLRSPTRFLAVLWWAVLHWLLNAFAYWLAFKAVGIEAPFSAAMFTQCVSAAFVSLPSLPGFFGLFEAAGKMGLGVYGIDAGLAATWAIGFHVLSFIPITLIGAYYFALEGLSFDELSRAGRGDSPLPAENE